MPIWYPSLAALDDLTVTETDDGFEFSAPDGSECATWLGYFNSTEELQEEFNVAITNVVKNRIEELDNGNQKQNA